jgi:uncharacterized repeat protein (TIGR01451 family)
MNNKTSTVKIFKNHEDKSLQKAEANFSVFSEDVLEMKKIVDKPEEYYTEGDPISFTISLKNTGDKVITNFKLKDELEDYIKPFGDNYKVVASKGQITSYHNPITIEGITLAPKEVMTVKITGVIE